MTQKNKKQKRYTKAPIKTKIKKGGRILFSLALNKRGASQLIPKCHINQGDNVVVISGKDKGKTGKVLKVFRKENKITVEGVHIIKKHKKPMGPGRPGEIVESEGPIFASKVMHWDEAKKKASRVKKKFLDNKKKVRIYQTSGEQID